MGSKRGEITSEQLIGLILVAVGFIIVIAFFTQLGTKEYTSDELCKFSVLSRATAEEVKSGTGSYLPLQCTTKKICIVAGKNGECKQFAGEQDVSYVYLPSFTQNDQSSITLAANEIARVSAESLYTCWNNMGQGKLDLFNSVPESLGFDAFGKSTCVICSRVAIADDVPSYVLERVNVQTYMRTNTVPGSTETYLQALSGDDSTNTYTKINEDAITEGSGTGEDESTARRSETELKGLLSNPNETAFVFMQFKSSSISEVLQNQLQLGAGVAGGTFALAPSQVIRFTISKGAIVYTAIAATVVGGAGAAGSYLRQQTAVGYCGEFTTNSEDKTGCSLVQAVNYNVDDIKALCGSLQSNP